MQHSAAVFNILRLGSLSSSSRCTALLSKLPLRCYAAKVVSKAEPASASTTTTNNYLQRLRAIIQQKRTSAPAVSNTAVKYYQTYGYYEYAEEWTESVEDAASIRIETLGEEDDQSTVTEHEKPKRKAPKFWSEDTAALKRLREQGLEYPGSLLERGLDKSVSGRTYKEDDEIAIKNILDNCLLMVRHGGDKYMTGAGVEGATPGSGANRHLFVRALTHINYGTGKVPNNEYLSFIGKFLLESVLADIVAEKYSELHWRDLSSIRALYVCESTLAHVGRDLWGLVPVLRIYDWEKMSEETQDKFLADCVLATIGAVYDNYGPYVARQFLSDCFLKVLHDGPASSEEEIEAVPAGSQKTAPSSPLELVGRLLRICSPVRLLHDLLYAQQYALPKTIMTQEVNDKGQYEYVCSLYYYSELVGYARAQSRFAAHTVAASNAVLQLTNRLPNY